MASAPDVDTCVTNQLINILEALRSKDQHKIAVAVQQTGLEEEPPQSADHDSTVPLHKEDGHVMSSSEIPPQLARLANSIALSVWISLCMVLRESLNKTFNPYLPTQSGDQIPVRDMDKDRLGNFPPNFIAAYFLGGDAQGNKPFKFSAIFKHDNHTLQNPYVYFTRESSRPGGIHAVSLQPDTCLLLVQTHHRPGTDLYCVDTWYVPNSHIHGDDGSFSLEQGGQKFMLSTHLSPSFLSGPCVICTKVYPVNEIMEETNLRTGIRLDWGNLIRWLKRLSKDTYSKGWGEYRHIEAYLTDFLERDGSLPALYHGALPCASVAEST